MLPRVLLEDKVMVAGKEFLPEMFIVKTIFSVRSIRNRILLHLSVTKIQNRSPKCRTDLIQPMVKPPSGRMPHPKSKPAAIPRAHEDYLQFFACLTPALRH